MTMESENDGSALDLLAMEPADVAVYLKGEGIPEDVCCDFEGQC